MLEPNNFYFLFQIQVSSIKTFMVLMLDRSIYTEDDVPF